MKNIHLHSLKAPEGFFRKIFKEKSFLSKSVSKEISSKNFKSILTFVRLIFLISQIFPSLSLWNILFFPNFKSLLFCLSIISVFLFQTFDLDLYLFWRVKKFSQKMNNFFLPLWTWVPLNFSAIFSHFKFRFKEMSSSRGLHRSPKPRFLQAPKSKLHSLENLPSTLQNFTA